MPLKPRDDLPPAPSKLGKLSDIDRKISGGPVFALPEVQSYVKHLDGNAFRFADQASLDLTNELGWTLHDLCGFIQCLATRHYRYSEWCYGSEKAKIAFPADVYIMGYSRMKGAEWPQQNPWNYLKISFSSVSNSVHVFSIHPEKPKK
jgi:hypothetical protein